jgi:hypothetical protein
MITKKQPMKILSPFVFGLSLLLFQACGSDAPSSQQTNGADGSDTAAVAETPSLPTSHDCQPGGEILDGNQFWARDLELLLVIKADDRTFDESFGASHRALEIYDTKDCRLVDRQELPINVSPDFPYYLAEITYNSANKLLAIKGFSTIYIYDLAARRLLPQLEPQFRKARYGVDAQSGMIHRLEVWENYLVGYAQDYGSFAFDLSQHEAPKAALPFAEYEQEEKFYSLFIFPSGVGHQAVMPEYDWEAGEFSINPAFEQPLPLNLDATQSARNNRFLVLRQTDAERTPQAFDLLKRERVELPTDVAAQQTQGILDWLRRNRR